MGHYDEQREEDEKHQKDRRAKRAFYLSQRITHLDSLIKNLEVQRSVAGDNYRAFIRKEYST